MDIRRRLRLREDRGETLLELLVSITILGICVVAFGTSIAMAVTTSDRHRKEADAGALARDYAEKIDTYIANSSAHYVGCAPANTYTPTTVGLSLPATYTAAQSAGYTIGANGAVGPCTADNGAQQLTLTVSSTDGRASEQLVVVIRKP